MITLILIVGGLMAVVGWVWILLTAFTENMMWALGIFLIGPLALVYGYLRWDELKTPTILLAIGGVLQIMGRVA